LPPASRMENSFSLPACSAVKYTVREFGEIA
jgi:hypothetical protein